MALTDFWIGPPGALVEVPPPARPIERPLSRPQATQETAGGANVVDRFGRGRRTYTLRWEKLTLDELAIIERLWLLPGALILDDPARRNRLTASQSTGSDTSRGAVLDVIARFQGTVASSTAQARTGSRSWAWNTSTALGATNRGLYCYTGPSLVDDSWMPVRAGGIYAHGGWMRATGAVAMYAGWDWHDAVGAYLSTSAFGSPVTLTTTGWQLVQRTGVAAPAGAAYGIPFYLNQATTAGAVTVYLDDPMASEVEVAGTGIGTYVVGTGVPRVSLGGELPETSELAFFEDVELTAQEL